MLEQKSEPVLRGQNRRCRMIHISLKPETVIPATRETPPPSARRERIGVEQILAIADRTPEHPELTALRARDCVRDGTDARRCSQALPRRMVKLSAGRPGNIRRVQVGADGRDTFREMPAVDALLQAHGNLHDKDEARSTATRTSDKRIPSDIAYHVASASLRVAGVRAAWRSKDALLARVVFRTPPPTIQNFWKVPQQVLHSALAAKRPRPRTVTRKSELVPILNRNLVRSSEKTVRHLVPRRGVAEWPMPRSPKRRRPSISRPTRNASGSQRQAIDQRRY
jgi:hypothetical protein